MEGEVQEEGSVTKKKHCRDCGYYRTNSALSEIDLKKPGGPGLKKGVLMPDLVGNCHKSHRKLFSVRASGHACKDFKRRMI